MSEEINSNKTINRSEFLTLVMACFGLSFLHVFAPNLFYLLKLSQDQEDLMLKYLKRHKNKNVFALIDRSREITSVKKTDDFVWDTKCEKNTLTQVEIIQASRRWHGPESDRKYFTTETNDAIYEEYYLPDENGKSKLYFRRIFALIGQNDDFQIWLSAESDLKKQSLAFLQGGEKERGDIKLNIISKTPGKIISGVILDFSALAESDNVDALHQFKLNLEDDYATHNEANYYNSYTFLTRNMGSLIPRSMDLLRKDSLEDLSNEIDSFREFGVDLMQNSLLLLS